MSLTKVFFLLWLLGLIGLILADLGNIDLPNLFFQTFLIYSLCCLIALLVKNGLLKMFARKCWGAMITVWIIASVTFLLLRFLPGGPFEEEKALSPLVKANIEAKYGLTSPLAVQYLNYFKNALKGDLGPSYKYEGRGVSEILWEGIPVSLQLGFYALLFAFSIGIPLGVYSASHIGQVTDKIAMTLAISGVALPSFFIGPLLVQIFCFGHPFAFLHGLLPPALWESSIYYILPVVTLGIRPAAIIARLVRTSVLETIDSDYVRTARAKGLSEGFILYQHILRNSLIPTLAVMGPLAAGVLSGSFVVELIFAVPGIGKHLVQSVINRDYPLIMGATLVYALLLVGVNLVIDILYGIVDPRMRNS